jgi:hypothetical protein
MDSAESSDQTVLPQAPVDDGPPAPEAVRVPEAPEPKLPALREFIAKKRERERQAANSEAGFWNKED